MCECLTKCGAKLILIVMSVAFSLAGVFLFFFGLISVVNQNMLLKILGTPDSIIAYLGAENNAVLGNVVGSGVAISVVGLVMMGLGFIGWIGACCGCRLCLLGYSVVLIVVCAVEIALIVVIALTPAKVDSKLIDDMNENMAYYVGQGIQYNKNGDIVTGPEDTDVDMNYSWDYLQIQGQCCGSYNYTSWADAKYTGAWNTTYEVCLSGSCEVVPNAVVPLSCCKVNDPSFYPDEVAQLTFVNAETCLLTADPLYTNIAGCYGDIKTTVTQYSNTIIAIAAVSLAIEIVNIFAACYVFKHTGLIV